MCIAAIRHIKSREINNGVSFQCGTLNCRESHLMSLISAAINHNSSPVLFSHPVPYSHLAFWGEGRERGEGLGTLGTLRGRGEGCRVIREASSPLASVSHVMIISAASRMAQNNRQIDATLTDDTAARWHCSEATEASLS